MTPWQADESAAVGDVRSHDGKTYRCLHKAWAFVEPASLNGQLGWELVQEEQE